MDNRAVALIEEPPTLDEVSAHVWQLIFELGGTRDRPCWQKLAKVLTGKKKKPINRGLLKQVADKELDSNVIRRALKLPIIHKVSLDPRRGYYRPRFSPAFMAAVLASEAEQAALLQELLDEFMKHTKENK